MPVTGVSQGFEGFGAFATESVPGGTGTPGLWVTPTQFLLLENDTIDSVPAMVTRDVIANSRDADRGYRTGKHKVSGQLTTALYPTNGGAFIPGAIGKDTTPAAIASDTTATITTANGMTTLTLTTGTGAYTVGRLVYIDTGAAQEIRQICSWNAGTKTMTVGALNPNITHAGSGTTVVVPQQHWSSPFTTTDGVANQLRTFSYLQSVGDKWQWKYPYGQVGRYDINATAARIAVTIEMVFSVPRILNTSPLAFDETDASLNDLSFEYTDGFMAFPADQNATGTPALQRVDLGQDFTISVQNNMKEENCLDGSEAIRHFPGRRQVTASYKFLSTGNEPVAFTRFLTKNLDVPFFTQFALNVGTPTTPVWHAIGIYLPTCRFTQATPIRGINDDIGEQINMTARRANGLEKIYVALLTGSDTAPF